MRERNDGQRWRFISDERLKPEKKKTLAGCWKPLLLSSHGGVERAFISQ